VQGEVKRTKTRFDQLKVDTMQKVDLLVASHCSMYSRVLADYQRAFRVFFKRIALCLTAVAESVLACQYDAFGAVEVRYSTPHTSGPVSTSMGDRLQAGKPSRYVASHVGRLSLLPSVSVSLWASLQLTNQD